MELSFIVDGMLGKLCRWLRMLGYDTLYLGSSDSDNELIKLALESSRILLTRDFQLYRKALKSNVKAIYVKSGIVEDQLRQLALDCGIELSMNFNCSRCPLCNHPLKRISVNEISNRIPESVKLNSKIFWFCDNCSKIYWIGKHWIDIEYKLMKAKSQILH